MDVILRVLNQEQHQQQLNELYAEVDAETGNRKYPELVWQESSEQQPVLDDQGNPVLDDETGEPLTVEVDTSKAVWNVASIPEDTKGQQSIGLVRVENTELIDLFNHAEKMGECIGGEYVFDNNGKKNVYENHRKPFEYEVDDGEGGTITVTKPYMVGVFF